MVVLLALAALRRGRAREASQQENGCECYLIRSGFGYFRLNFEAMLGEYCTRDSEQVRYRIRRLAPGRWEKRSEGNVWEPLQQGFADSFGKFDEVAEAAYASFVASIEPSTR